MKTRRLPDIRPYSHGELAELLAMGPLLLHKILEPLKAEIGEPEDFTFNRPRYSVRQVKIIFQKLI